MSKGLTLIESLIALAIISFGVFFVILIFPLIIGSTYKNEVNNVALFLATATMEDLIAKDYSELENGDFLKENIEGFENYKIEINIDCFNPEGSCTEETGMKKITINAFSTVKEDEKGINLTTVVTKK